MKVLVVDGGFAALKLALVCADLKDTALVMRLSLLCSTASGKGAIHAGNSAYRPDNVAHPADFKDERMWVYGFNQLLQTLLHFRRINCPGKEL